MRAAIYCRISLDATGEALGVQRQEQDCRALIEGLGWTIVETYTDNDLSATGSKARPRYQAMLKAIEGGEVDAIVAWAPDRLYRKLRDLEPLIEVMERRGTILKTVRGGEFDMGTPLGRMIARILASVATGEGEVKSDRWKRSVRQRRERGDLPRMGPRLYGYDAEGGIVEHEAAVIKAAVDELLDGVPIIRVAHNMNDRGSRTTLGNEWSRPSAAKLLRNGRLAGHSMLNGEILAAGSWPAIVDEQTFEQLQSILDARRGTSEQRPRVSLLLGIIHCALCGEKLASGGRSARGTGNRQRVYRCPTGPAQGGCGKIGVAADPVEEMVEAYARARWADPRVAARIDGLRSETGAATAEVIAMEQRLRELEAELDKPGVPVAAITRAMERTEESIARLRALPAGPVLRGGKPWPDDLARRARLVRLVVERVEIRPARFGGRFDVERVDISPAE